MILTDVDGVVLERRTGDSNLGQALDRIWLAPGFSYAERFVGTNGIGTALEGRGPAEVFGHEHYAEPLAPFACSGAPIWHPVSGKLLALGEDFGIPPQPEFDSTGIFFTPNLRHFDRGSKQRKGTLSCPNH